MLATRAALGGRRHTAMRFSCGTTLSVVDELGCLPPPAEVAAGLFEVVQRRYLKGSVIVTTVASAARARSSTTP